MAARPYKLSRNQGTPCCGNTSTERMCSISASLGQNLPPAWSLHPHHLNPHIYANPHAPSTLPTLQFQCICLVCVFGSKLPTHTQSLRPGLPPPWPTYLHQSTCSLYAPQASCAQYWFWSQFCHLLVVYVFLAPLYVTLSPLYAT